MQQGETVVLGVENCSYFRGPAMAFRLSVLDATRDR
jgi:hypothetical protein